MSAVLEALRTHADATPDAPALSGSGRSLSYSRLCEEASCIARLWAAHEVRVLAIAADNSAEWVVADLAAQIAGVTLVPLPLFFSADQTRHVLDDCGADSIVSDAVGHSRLGAASLRFAAEVSDTLALWRVPGVYPAKRPPALTAKISYTSGTTGRPKGVCLTQSVMDRVAASLDRVTAELKIDRHVCLLPLATLLENIAGVYAPLLAGAEVVVPGLGETGLLGSTGLDVERLVACIAGRRAESVILLPQMLGAVVAAAEAGLSPPASLRFVAVGGGFVPVPLLERADRLGLPVYEGYGLTECASVVALNTPAARRRGSVGRPLPHAELRIGADSQILVAGAAMSGYVGDSPVAAAEIPTGDIGYLDDDGFLYISGRRKNVFITSFGRNVSPEWVEAELVDAPSIRQAALFGEARPSNVAVIAAAPGASLATVQGEIDLVNARLPDYARAHQWIAADEPFTPANGLTTANGRNRRTAIWERYRARVDACYDRALGRYA